VYLSKSIVVVSAFLIHFFSFRPPSFPGLRSAAVFLARFLTAFGSDLVSFPFSFFFFLDVFWVVNVFSWFFDYSTSAVLPPNPFYSIIELFLRHLYKLFFSF